MNEISVPKTIQGIYKFCPVGGLDGIFVTEQKLRNFAKKVGTQHIDEIIPLPSYKQIHPDDCSSDHDDFREALQSLMYWETPKGSHGWCCSVCGKVLQWG